MKNTIILPLLLFFAPGLLNAMEESANTQKKEPIAQEFQEHFQLANGWEHLPTEIKYHILTFLPELDNYKYWLNAELVNKSFRHLVADKFFIQDFAQRLAEHRPAKAEILLNEAVKHGNVALTKALRKASDTLSDQAEKLLFNAIKDSDTATIQTLLDAGVNINAVNNANITPLLAAFILKAPLLADWFIQQGAEVNVPGKPKTTPLILATKLGNADLVQKLLSKRANINAKDELGQTALMVAAKLGFEKIVRILMSNKAKIAIKDNSGRTAYGLALNNRYTKIANMLKPPAKLPSIPEEKLKSFLFFM